MLPHMRSCNICWQCLTGAASACPGQFGKPLNDVSFVQQKLTKVVEAFRGLRMRLAVGDCSVHHTAVFQLFTVFIGPFRDA